MTPAATLQRFRKNEHGGVLLLWAVCVVMILGFFGLIFDVGRLAATQSELQSYADSVSLAAAAELDGKSDSIARATSAASSLISDSQTFGEGAHALDFANDVTLVFYKPGSDGKFQRSAALETTNSYAARFVEARIRDRDIRAAVSAAFSSLTGEETPDSGASASGVAGFSLEACNVAPVAMCLPAVDFDAASNIGKTLEVKLDVNVSRLIPGQLRAVHTLTDSSTGCKSVRASWARALPLACWPRVSLKQPVLVAVGCISPPMFPPMIWPMQSTHGSTSSAVSRRVSRTTPTSAPRPMC
ncbi:pilus assembly protein TadG-related protein [Sulfitobacter porphyrae]|uniref:Pilus assembly protein TadG-related protein n=1 Tax=Sulfitobacter porphyrae TaxID=1246864 RepID=A0ABW2AYR6_9RHOB